MTNETDAHQDLPQALMDEWVSYTPEKPNGDLVRNAVITGLLLLMPYYFAGLSWAHLQHLLIVWALYLIYLFVVFLSWRRHRSLHASEKKSTLISALALHFGGTALFFLFISIEFLVTTLVTLIATSSDYSIEAVILGSYFVAILVWILAAPRVLRRNLEHRPNMTGGTIPMLIVSTLISLGIIVGRLLTSRLDSTAQLTVFSWLILIVAFIMMPLAVLLLTQLVLVSRKLSKANIQVKS